MKPKELTPEEIIEELCGKKEYYNHGRQGSYLTEGFDTKKVRAWTRDHHQDRHRKITVELNVPKTCTKISIKKLKCKCTEAKKKRDHDFSWQFNMTGLNHCYTVFFFEGLRDTITSKLEKKWGKKYGLYVGENCANITAIWVKIPNGESSLATLEPHQFSISVEADEYFPECFPETKELAIDLLKIYLEAHKDCCTW